MDDQQDDDVMEISEADELIIDLKEIPKIKKYQHHIKDAFGVEVTYGLVSDEEHQKQWISLEGERGDRAVAKDYIKALCNPEESFIFSYPDHMHGYLTKIKVHGKIERQSRTAILFQDIGEMRIQGTQLHVTLGLSAVEDLVGRYHQDQADQSGSDLSLLGEYSPPVQRQSSARLSSELHRLTSKSQREIDYEDNDLDSMPDHIKRTMISVYQDIEQGTPDKAPGSTESDNTQVKRLESADSKDSEFVNLHRPRLQAIAGNSQPATSVRNPVLHEGHTLVANNLGNLQLASSGTVQASTLLESPMSSGDEGGQPPPSFSGLPLLSQYSRSVHDASRGQSPPPPDTEDHASKAGPSSSDFVQADGGDGGLSSFHQSAGELDAAEYWYTQVIPPQDHLWEYAQNHGYSDEEIKRVFEEKGADLTTKQFLEQLDLNRQQQTPARKKGVAKGNSAISGHKSIVEASGQTQEKSEKLQTYLKQLERDCKEEEEENLSREDHLKKNAERQKILETLYRTQQEEANKDVQARNTPTVSKSKRKRNKRKKTNAKKKQEPPRQSQSGGNVTEKPGASQAASKSDTMLQSDTASRVMDVAEDDESSDSVEEVTDGATVPFNRTGLTPNYVMVDDHIVVSSSSESDMDDKPAPLQHYLKNASQHAHGSPEGVAIHRSRSPHKAVKAPVQSLLQSGFATGGGYRVRGRSPSPKSQWEESAASNRGNKFRGHHPHQMPQQTAPPAHPVQQQTKASLLGDYRIPRLTQPLPTYRSPLVHHPYAPEVRMRQAANRKAKLRYIVIDGSNVAMEHGNGRVFSCKGIQLCVDYFRKRGHKEITAFIPQWRMRTNAAANHAKDHHLLEQLRSAGFLVLTPSRRIPDGRNIVSYDDRFVLRLAYEHDGVVVTNDNYRDLWLENRDWRGVIEKQLLPYSFVADLFMPPDDPLGRDGPHLDDFLKKFDDEDTVGQNMNQGGRQLPPAESRHTYGNPNVHMNHRPRWPGEQSQVHPPPPALMLQQPNFAGLQRQPHPNSNPNHAPNRGAHGRGAGGQVGGQGAGNTPRGANRQPQQRQQQQKRSPQDTSKIFQQLTAVFPNQDNAIRKVLEHHPGEMSPDVLSAHLLEQIMD